MQIEVRLKCWRNIHCSILQRGQNWTSGLTGSVRFFKMYFTSEEGMAESSALFRYVIPDLRRIHRWPTRIIYIIIFSDPFSLKGREEAQISVNLTLPFSRNCQAIWRYPRALEKSGWVLAYSSSPTHPVPMICSENLSLKHEGKRLWVKTESHCKKWTWDSCANLLYCGQYSTKPSPNTCRKTSPKAFAFNVFPLKGM